VEQQGSPLVLSRADGGVSPRVLKRHSLKGEFDEDWLQAVVDRAPNLLPVSEIDPRVHGQLHSLGREVATPAGPIDNLLLSESGHLVVVETKLWRNPEARRTVVAQLLDYAAWVRAWNYEKLEKIWRSRNPGASLWETVRPDDDEAEWIDRVEDNLAVGRMTLLVVGDGVESRAEALAEVVAGTPDFQFRLALVELRVFELSKDEFVILPSTLARTAEIERATVRIVFEGTARPEVSVEVPRPDKQGRTASGSRVTLDAQAMFASMEEAGQDGVTAAAVARELLRLVDSQPELTVDWKSSGFVVKTTDPLVPGAVLSLVVVSRPNLLFYYPWVHGQISKGWDDKAAAEQVSDLVAGVVRDFGGVPVGMGHQINLPLTSLRGQEAQLIDALSDAVERIASMAVEHGDGN
jgi:hypothetical protein